MKFITAIFLATFFTTSLIFSQGSKVEEIDKEVEEFYQTLEDEISTRSFFTVVNSEVQRAVGPVLKTTYIFYDIIELPIEIGPGPVEFGRARNLKAYLESTEAGSYTIEKSWFYNDEGILIFYTEKNSASGCGVIKCYFDNNEVIRIVSSTLSPEEYSYEMPDEAECNYIRDTGEFSPEDLKKIDEVQSQKTKQINMLNVLSEERF